MVILDYRFDRPAVIDWCRQHPFPTDDTSLGEILMPARLSMDGAEVFGVREAYHRDNVARADLPSRAWTTAPVLELALCCQEIVTALENKGQCLFMLGDTALDMVVHGLWVTVHYDLAMAEVGHARFDQFKDALVAFTDRVRRDFVNACPDLRHHLTLSGWFQRTEM